MSILTRPPRTPLNTLQTLLKECYSTPACHRSPIGRRHHATKPPGPPEGADVAILGGGITGLASAHYLSRSRPDIKVTLFESSKRLGGWLHSTFVDVGTGEVVFEQGPRNLRPTVPNGLVTLDLVSENPL